MNDSNHYTVAGAHALMGAGKLTAVQLAEDCLARIEQREREIGAWSHIDPEQVLAQARARDREPRRSPLHGIPVGVKDIIDTSDMPTEYGSPIYAGHRPYSDAACVAMLRDAGAVIMGKTVTVEFAMHHPGKTRNPHNPAHTPGGSSSGSAAAVADFMVPLALGTQTGGSTIRPAAFCGIVGFKPTFNVINRAGVKPVAESLDTVGILGRAVADVKLVFSVFTGSVANSVGSPGKPEDCKPRIGFCRTPQWQYAEPATMDALEKAVSRLGQKGADIAEVSLPRQFDEMLSAHAAINDYESWRAFGYERANFPEKLSATLSAKFEKAVHRTLAEYLGAQQAAADRRRQLSEVFSEYDVLLVASAPGEAPAGLDSTGDAIFNRMWTALHVPSITLPVFRGPSNLPMGVQLVGPFGSDNKLLKCAEWVHHALI